MRLTFLPLLPLSRFAISSWIGHATYQWQCYVQEMSIEELLFKSFKQCNPRWFPWLEILVSYPLIERLIPPRAACVIHAKTPQHNTTAVDEITLRCHHCSIWKTFCKSAHADIFLAYRAPCKSSATRPQESQYRKELLSHHLCTIITFLCKDFENVRRFLARSQSQYHLHQIVLDSWTRQEGVQRLQVYMLWAKRHCMVVDTYQPLKIMCRLRLKDDNPRCSDKETRRHALRQLASRECECRCMYCNWICLLSDLWNNRRRRMERCLHYIFNQLYLDTRNQSNHEIQTGSRLISMQTLLVGRKAGM